jgi:hypothetical protein
MMAKKVKIEFQIKGIELVEVSLNPPSDSQKKTKVFQYNINLEHRIIPENKWFLNRLNIDIYTDDQKTRVGHIQTVINFEINNFDAFLDEEKTKIDLPEDIITTFNSISISTTRGIMFSQFRGTYLHNAILPLVDPKSLVKQDVPKL